MWRISTLHSVAEGMAWTSQLRSRAQWATTRVAVAVAVLEVTVVLVLNEERPCRIRP